MTQPVIIRVSAIIFTNYQELSFTFGSFCHIYSGLFKFWTFYIYFCIVPISFSMKLFIQNMVSLRCKMLVRSELEKLGLKVLSVELGEIQIAEELTESDRQLLSNRLHSSGLELMEDKVAMIIEKIKNIIVEMVHYSDEPIKDNFSDYLSNLMKKDYHQLSVLFSKTKGITIEHFIIIHRIERVKELIIYDELTISEIAWKLNYSSVSHLSSQFKKVTGLSPTEFKNLLSRRRNTLESL
jgi:YesN/AraC family two-component response regulator